MLTRGILLLLLVLLSLLACAAEGVAVGWMRDGSGDFQDQNPPHTWNDATGENVRWKVHLPNWSNSSPVVAGDRVYVMSEPYTGMPELFCIDAESGRVLWRQEIDWTALLPKDEAAQVRGQIAGFYDWAAQLLREYAEFRELGPNEPGASPARERWQAAMARATALGFSGKFGVRAGGSMRMIMQGSADPHCQAMDAFERRYGYLFGPWGPGIARGVYSGGLFGETWDGMAYPTPVADDRHVWVVTAHNVAACFDRDGNRVWLRRFPRPLFQNLSQAQQQFVQEGRSRWPLGWPGDGHFSTSPLFCDGKLILNSGAYLRVLDAATGETLWEMPDRGLIGQNMSVPQLMTTGGTTIILTAAKGDAYRLSDGAFLGSVLAPNAKIADPIRVWRDIAVCLNGDGRGITGKRVRLQDGELVADTLWTAPVAPWRAAIAQEDGKLYGKGFMVDLATGTVTGDARRGLPNAGGGYCWAMRLLVQGCELSVDGQKGLFVFRDLATNAEVGRVQMDVNPFGDTHADYTASRIGLKRWCIFGAGLPFAYRDRLYIRSHDYLYCIGRE